MVATIEVAFLETVAYISQGGLYINGGKIKEGAHKLAANDFTAYLEAFIAVLSIIK
jgi:hypothetical protein